MSKEKASDTFKSLSSDAKPGFEACFNYIPFLGGGIFRLTYQKEAKKSKVITKQIPTGNPDWDMKIEQEIVEHVNAFKRNNRMMISKPCTPHNESFDGSESSE
jgi:hypothetical protein